MIKKLLIFAALWIGLQSFAVKPDWGFYAHRLINRMSVFTLPPELIGFYKTHIGYMTEHAVDPDKRRYATKHEEYRHFIDIDHWDKFPFTNVPRDFEEAIIKYCKIRINSRGDTVYFDKIINSDTVILSTKAFGGITLGINYNDFVRFWKRVIKPMYYEEQWKLSGYDLDELFNTTYFQRHQFDVLIEDEFSKYGIIPYHLEQMQSKLTNAFEKRDFDLILKLSADFGHYIGDANVPLHTTSNYNGQMTNQLGIHAFWESRVPELFAEREYDFFVGKAEYIENKRDYFWNMVIRSHSLLDSIFSVERRLSRTYDSDRQFCYDERLGQTVRIQCEDYAKAFAIALDNTIEEQMRRTISAIGACIYSAWVDAGQPVMDGKITIGTIKEEIIPDKSINPRPHEND